MTSRRGTLLIVCSALLAWALSCLNLSVTVSSRSFTRPPLHPFIALAPASRGCSSKSRLELLPRSFFSKGRSSSSIANKGASKSFFKQDPSDAGASHDTLLGFGRHADLTYSEVVRDYPHYCASILALDDLGNKQMKILVFQHYLKKNSFEAPLSFSPTSRSKHAGKTFREVMEAEPLYCSWVLKSDFPALARFRNFLEDEGYKAPDMHGILPFGRYKGKAFSEVLQEDPAYCMWVKHLEGSVSGMLLDFQNYLKEQGSEDVLTFGKHKGLPYDEVMTVDPSYCSWVMSLTTTGTKNPALLRFKEFLEDQGFTPSSEENLLRVGKHKGMTFKQVMTKEPLYCAWVMSLAEETGSNKNLMQLKSFLEKQGFQAPAATKKEKESASTAKKHVWRKLESSSVLRVGKHKGKSFAELMEEEPSYCSWVMSLQSDGTQSKALLGFKSFLEEQGFQAPATAKKQPWNANRMPVGKYKGMTFAEVLKEDPTYCSWVMGLPTEDTKSKALLNFQSFLVDKGVNAQPLNVTVGK